MARHRLVVRATWLPLEADRVWERVTTPEGVNHELGPWMRMTVPEGWGDRSIADLDPPETIGRSWILALGILPIDFDRIRIAELGERRFQEDSKMLTMSSWRHERIVVPANRGSVVADRVEMRPRWPLRWLPGFGRAYAFVVRRIFAHRHRRLRRWARRAARR